MNTLRTGYLVLAAVLLTLWADVPLTPLRASAAQIPAGARTAGDVASLTCAAPASGWTDCAVNVARSLSPGGSIAASLPSGQGNIAYCSDGSASGTPACSIGANTAIFLCPHGCAAGTQFVLGVLDAPAAAGEDDLAQFFELASSNPIPVARGEPVLAGAPTVSEQ